MGRVGRVALGVAAVGAALAALAVLAGPALMAPRVIKPDASARGEVQDSRLRKEAPKGGYVTDRKTYDALVHSWAVQDPPEVDFRTHLVLVDTTTAGRYVGEGSVRLHDGDLLFNVRPTDDPRPGFRYILLVVPKEGVKKVNGNVIE